MTGFVLLVQDVDRNEDDPRLGARNEENDVLRPVGQIDREAIAGRQPSCQERSREAVAPDRFRRTSSSGPPIERRAIVPALQRKCKRRGSVMASDAERDWGSGLRSGLPSAFQFFTPDPEGPTPIALALAMITGGCTAGERILGTPDWCSRRRGGPDAISVKTDRKWVVTCRSRPW